MINIWIVDTKQIGILPQYLLNHLDRTEEERAQKIRSPQERRQFIIGRIMLRKALSESIGGETREWSFITGESGKVRLANLPGLPFVDFNLSHSNGVIAIAISTNGQIGVDLEVLSKFSKIDDEILTASHANIFNRDEQKFLDQNPSDTRWREVLRLWSVKEAYAKLLGLGTQIEFDTIDTFSSFSGVEIQTQEVQVDKRAYFLTIAKRSASQSQFTSSLRMANSFHSVNI